MKFGTALGRSSRYNMLWDWLGSYVSLKLYLWNIHIRSVFWYYIYFFHFNLVCFISSTTTCSISNTEFLNETVSTNKFFICISFISIAFFLLGVLIVVWNFYEMKHCWPWFIFDFLFLFIFILVAFHCFISCDGNQLKGKKE